MKPSLPLLLPLNPKQRSVPPVSLNGHGGHIHAPVHTQKHTGKGPIQNTAHHRSCGPAAIPTVPEAATEDALGPETRDAVGVARGSTSGGVRIGPEALEGKPDHLHQKEVKERRRGSAAGTEGTAPHPERGAAKTRTG